MTSRPSSTVLVGVCLLLLSFLAAPISSAVWQVLVGQPGNDLTGNIFIPDIVNVNHNDTIIFNKTSTTGTSRFSFRWRLPNVLSVPHNVRQTQVNTNNSNPLFYCAVNCSIPGTTDCPPLSGQTTQCAPNAHPWVQVILSLVSPVFLFR